MLHRINTKSLEDYLATQTFSAPEQARNILHMIQGFAKHYVDSPFDVPATQRSPDLNFAVRMISPNGDKGVTYSWNVGCSGVSASTECLEAPHSVTFHSKSGPTATSHRSAGADH
ncbi:uncharacterized protein [Tenebrio molitor]|uniref:uncharacterized protein n=1 Tax=Tenebrio molitor TaxID=7067 RepID=UPI001C3C047E|nr:unnamed protein product [Tenebrio molitor]